MHVTLHEEIAAILAANGNRRMTLEEITETVNRRGRYRRGDGKPLGPKQIGARVAHRFYRHLFERRDGRIRLVL